MQAYRCDQCFTFSSAEQTRTCRNCSATICYSCRDQHTARHQHWQQPQQPFPYPPIEPPPYNPSAYGTSHRSTPNPVAPVQPQIPAFAPPPGSMPSSLSYAMPGSVPANLCVERKRDGWMKSAKNFQEKKWVRRSLKVGGAIGTSVVIGAIIGVPIGFGDDFGLSGGEDIVTGGGDSMLGPAGDASTGGAPAYISDTVPPPASAPTTVVPSQVSIPDAGTILGQSLVAQQNAILIAQRVTFAGSHIG